jgi:hypothetical protein
VFTDGLPPEPGDDPDSLLPEQAIRPTSVHRGNRERRCMMTMIVPHFLGPGCGFPHFQRGGVNEALFVSPQSAPATPQTDRRHPGKTGQHPVVRPRQARGVRSLTATGATGMSKATMMSHARCGR